MLVDLHLANKKVVVVGGGSVGERKAAKLLQEKSRITIVSKGFTHKLRRLAREGKVKLSKVDMDSNSSSLDSMVRDAHLVIAATTSQRLNRKISAEARRAGALVCVVDDPSRSDFLMPAITNIGGIQIAIYTGGKSPAMARILRQRIEKMLTEEDILQVKLQDYARRLVKSQVHNESQRRKVLYQIIHDKDVKSRLKKGSFEEAKIRAAKIIGFS